MILSDHFVDNFVEIYQRRYSLEIFTLDIFIRIASDSKWVNSEGVVQALALILCCMHAAIQIIANPSGIFFWMFVQSFQAVPGPHTWISRFASTPVQGWSLLITGTHGFIMVLESCMEMGIGKIWRCLMFEAESSRDGNLPWSGFKQTLRYSDNLRYSLLENEDQTLRQSWIGILQPMSSSCTGSLSGSRPWGPLCHGDTKETATIFACGGLEECNLASIYQFQKAWRMLKVLYDTLRL